MSESAQTTDFHALQLWSGTLFSGRHIRFRELQESDLPELCSWWNNPFQSVLQQERITLRPPEALAAMFTSWSKNDAASGFGYSIIDADGALAGHVSAWGLSVPERIATMAIIIGPDFQGRGIGREALQLALRLAFDELGAHKVELQTWSYNDRAIRLYSSLGFTIEGRRRAAVFHRGSFQDQILMGLLAEEYRAAPEPDDVSASTSQQEETAS